VKFGIFASFCESLILWTTKPGSPNRAKEAGREKISFFARPDPNRLTAIPIEDGAELFQDTLAEPYPEWFFPSKGDV